jgi:hypothetical protein
MFHLLSFGEEPEFEMSSRIEGTESIETIVSHLLLLKPLEVHTDFTAAMKYLVEYVDGLSLSSKKRILIITDGQNDPPPDSPYRDEGENRERIRDLSEYMKRNGWNVKVLQFGEGPGGQRAYTGTGEDADDSLITEIEESFDKKVVVDGDDSTTGGDVLRPHIEVGFPDKLLKGKEKLRAPFSFTNPGEAGRTLRVSELRFGDQNLLLEPQSITLTPGETARMSLPLTLPREVGTEKTTIEVELRAAEGGPLAPATGALTMQRSTGLFAGVQIGSTLLWIVLGVVLLAVLLLLLRRIFSATATTGSRERQPVGTAAGSELAGRSTQRERDREAERTLGSAAARKGGDSSADLQSFADATRSSDDATILSGARSGGKNETELKKSGHSEGQEAADILSQASRQRAAETSLSAGETDSPEKALQRAAQERKDRQRNLKARLAARKRAGEGGGVRLPFPREASMSALASLRKEGKLPVEMKVEFQRNSRGANLLWFEEGTSYSVGAPGEADFSITSVPVEGLIGHVVMEKGKLVFYSESRRYFPELEGPVRDCFKTPILVRSPETEEEATIRFQEYVHPLERINRIMHLIDRPGKPEFDY